MNILLIDTSTHTARVALENDGKIVEERTWPGDRTLGRVLLEKISELFQVQSMGWDEIDQIAVIQADSGGSFMAQRTGRITASMLAEANSKEVVVRKSS